jgi:glycosyltransferase involved in cell wall biosynthesis
MTAPGGKRAPRVTICVPTWNRAPVLPRTLATIRDQTFNDSEIIICDDGSVDGSRSLLQSLEREGVCRVLFNERNRGLPATMNRLFAEAQGEYLGIFHDHDLYAPTLVEKSLAALDAHPAAVLSFTGVVMMDALTDEPGPVYISYGGPLVPRARLLKSLIIGPACPMASAGVLIRASALAQAGGYDPTLGLCGDVGLWIRLLELGDAVYIAEPLVSLRGRTPAEQVRNGSWDALLGYGRLQSAACERVYRDQLATRLLGGLRIRARLLRQVLLESVSLWLRGNAELLRLGDAALKAQGWGAMGLAPRALAAGAGVGQKVGNVRRRVLKKRRALS